jgi:hypothetical protein
MRDADQNSKEAGHAVGERLLTERELANRHGLSVRTVRNKRVTGGYVPFLKIGGAVRYSLADIEAYEDANTFNSTSARRPSRDFQR